MRVLLVEDNAANLELARYILAAAGHDVLLASDGLAGLEIATLNPPDLVLTDLQMPLMDGFALLAALRKLPHCARTPIIALTAFSMPGDAQRVLASGFDGYMSKPIEPENFAAELARFDPATMWRDETP